MMASAGTRLTSPSEVNEVVINAVAVQRQAIAKRPPINNSLKTLLGRRKKPL